MIFHLMAAEANRLIHRHFAAPHYDVCLAEDGSKMSFLVTGNVHKYQQNALKRIGQLDQRHLTGAAFNELAARGILALGRYVIWLDENAAKQTGSSSHHSVRQSNLRARLNKRMRQ